MKMNVKIACCTALGAALTFLPLNASRAEDHEETQQLKVSELGPYRPEHKADLKQARDLIVRQTNEFRREEDRKAVAVDPTLEKTAQAFADYMARTDRYGHTADGNEPAERATAQGYDYCAIEENIAYQFRTTGFPTDDLAKRFVEGWKKSPGHRANMLRTYVTQTGVAIAQSEKTGVFYAVQLFGRPKSESITFRVANESPEAVEYKLGDQKYELPPRVIRTHEICQPLKLKLLTADAKVEGDAAIEPKNGDRFTVRQTGARNPKLERSTDSE